MRIRSLALCGVVFLVTAPAPVEAQPLSDRVAAAGNGAVVFQFAARPVICGDGEHFVRTGRGSYHGSFSQDYLRAPCEFGPVQVRLTVVDGAVTQVRSWVGRPRDRAARNLGVVSAAEGARYLMTIAAHGAPAASARAIFAAVLADSSRVWPALLAIARDTDTRSRATRREAMLWLSRFAGAAVSGHPDDPFFDDGVEGADDELKTHAVFVLSQLRNGEGIPSLLEIARANPNPRVRSQAMFWLGQSGDPRAIDLFESVLRS
jgi:hypothetical protein